MRTPRPFHFSRSPIPIPDLPAPKSHQIISFADPQPLNSFASYRYKNTGGGGGRPRCSCPTISHSPYTLPSSVCRKSFACHSFENTGGAHRSSQKLFSPHSTLSRFSTLLGFFPIWNLPSAHPRKIALFLSCTYGNAFSKSFVFNSMREWGVPPLNVPTF